MNSKTVSYLKLLLAASTCVSALAACADNAPSSSEPAEHASLPHALRLSSSEYEVVRRVSDAADGLYSTADAVCSNSTTEECLGIADLAQQRVPHASLSSQDAKDADGLVTIEMSVYDEFVADLEHAYTIAAAVEGSGAETPAELVEASDELISSLTECAELAPENDFSFSNGEKASCPWWKKAGCAVVIATFAPPCATIASGNAAVGPESYQFYWQQCMRTNVGSRCWPCV